MDPRLLRYYDQELRHVREMGAEFAAQFPKVAARLGMHGIEVADPYVERLLEGFAFLAARVQLKLDAEFPRFTQRMLEIVYPQFLAPTPAMVIVQSASPVPDYSEAIGLYSDVVAQFPKFHLADGALYMMGTLLYEQGDRPGAGSDLQHRGRPCFQCQVNQHLGFRPRDQHPPVNGQLDVAETLLSEDVGDRLAPQPPSDRFGKGACHRSLQGLLAIGDQRGPVHPGQLGKQHLGVKSRRLDSRRGERVDRGCQGLGGLRPGGGQVQTAWASRRWRFSSAASASVN